MAELKERRSTQEVNAGSMADIAFLLLIFFLVTTQIVEDQGIRVKLPPYDPTIIADPVPSKNVLSVLINSSDELLIEGKRASIEELRSRTKDFIMNPQRLSTMPSNPKKAVVSLKNDRSTSYDTYLAVYNELKGAYHELWEAAAQKDFHKSYQQLRKEEQKQVRSIIPLIISEAEPSDYAGQ